MSDEEFNELLRRMRSFLQRLWANGKITSLDEAAIRQAVILPLLQILGWDTSNIDEVTPEFGVETKRVDYALCLTGSPEFFIEVKKGGEDLSRHEHQLLDYSFHHGVDLACLTNGVTWWFYLPKGRGDWKKRRFYTIDVLEQDAEDVASKFIDLLSKDSVRKGDAVRHAEAFYRDKRTKEATKEAVPQAWNKILNDLDPALVHLIAATTEKLCGFTPELEEVKRFLKAIQSSFLVQPEVVEERVSSKRLTLEPGDGKISQHDLVPHIVEVLRRHGGKARKQDVEDEIFERFKQQFLHPWYQETVSNGVPRWKHNLAWAKEYAKKKDLVRRPKESGRGFWELTAKGMNS